MSNLSFPRRQLGNSDLRVSPVALGLWPMAGITSIVPDDETLVRTIRTALDNGINFFDTAYSYGYTGESSKLLRRALAGRRDEAIIATKAAMYWTADKQRAFDSRPELLLKHAEDELQRLGVDYVDLFYLHTPTESVPIEESAAAVAEIVRRGWARYAGVSNVNAEQAQRFASVCPVVAVQPHFNMLQQSAVEDLRGFANETGAALVCYWVLMKGLLAGHLERDHQFDPRDRRLTYDIFQGDNWQRNQDFLDGLRGIAAEVGCTTAQLVVAWTIAQPNITVALCGAKHPEQILDCAGAMNVPIDAAISAKIAACISARGSID